MKSPRSIFIFLVSAFCCAPVGVPGQDAGGAAGSAPETAAPAAGQSRRLTPEQIQELRQRAAARRAAAASNDQARPASADGQAEPQDLASAVRSMNFDRTPEALLEVVRAQESGRKLSEAEQFRLAVLTGDWASVGKTLKTLPEAEAMQAYTRLLDSLAGNSQSAAQFFPQATPAPRSPNVYVPDAAPAAPQPRDRRGLLLSDDFYTVLDAAPAKLTEAQISSVAALVKVAVGNAGKQDFLARLARGLNGYGGDTPEGKKLAAQLLSAAGWAGDSGPYLPQQREQWDQADTLTLVLAMEYFTQTGIDQKDERQLKRAAELCAFMMQTRRFAAEKSGTFRQATERFVKLLPALQADEAEQLIRSNFLSQPALMLDLILALGEAGQQSQKSGDLALRGQRLATQSLLLRVLEGQSDPLPEAVNVLVMNWLAEAEQTYRAGVAAQLEASSGRAYYAQRGGRDTNILSSDVIVADAPAEAILQRLNKGLAQRATLTLLKVNLLDPKEPATLDLLRSYLKEHPGQEKELCQEYLAAWVRKRMVPPEDPNVARMRVLGYNITRQQAPTGIPLTRLRQNQNVRDYQSLLLALRELSPQPIDPATIVQGFMSIHSSAEVYRLDDIEAIFGAPEKMNRQELMYLVSGMRNKLREQWQDPKQQQAAGSNRTEQETKDEVSRGYRTAMELLRRGLRPEDAEWQQYILRGQLFFDASQYELERQIKLAEYINLRDEAFASFKKSCEIYAAKVPEMPRAQWTIQPYQTWFFVMLGASDLSQLTRTAARSDPGLKQIGDLMRALPGEAAEGHLQKFGQSLGDLLPQCPSNMRQQFLRSGLQIVGENHPSARAAAEALKNYQELLDEAQLRVTLDGPTRVGCRQPFGVFVSLEHTRQLGRESGGFARYLMTPSSQLRPGTGPKQINYREEFAKNIHRALDETFDVASITFHDSEVVPSNLPREGWQETPFAYLVLRAKDAAVDRIPSIELDMDFADASGQVVLPVLSQVQPIDAKDTEPVARPCDDLSLAFTMDEREWRDGRVVVEVAAKAHGIIPAAEQIFDYRREGFDVEVSDNGLSVAQFVTDGGRKMADAERGYQFAYRRKPDLRGDVVFHFPAIKGGIKPASVEYKHYQDADLVTVDAAKASEGVVLGSKVSTGLRGGLLVLVLAGMGTGVFIFLRLKARKAPVAAAPLVLPGQLTPFTTVAFLRRIQRDCGAKLGEGERAALQDEIGQIEAAFFSGAAHTNGKPDLEAIAHKWLRAAS